MKVASNAASWSRFPISQIEDLSNAVRGAGLDAMQMSRTPVIGSLAFASLCDVSYSSGYIGGHVALKGPLSENMVTLGLGVALTPGTSHWLKDVSSGDIGVFLPGDVHDALYRPGSIYAAATLSFDRLEEIASEIGLVLDAKTLGGSGVVRRRLADASLSRLQTEFRCLHSPMGSYCPAPAVLGSALLRELIRQLARPPRPQIGRPNLSGYALIFARAREYIHENLDQPLSIDQIATASFTSHRTLHRAFLTTVNESPYSYVQKVRLHRIRREFLSNTDKARAITLAAHRWGITELGRFAGWYRDLFGEVPSATLATRRPHVRDAQTD